MKSVFPSSGKQIRFFSNAIHVLQMEIKTSPGLVFPLLKLISGEDVCLSILLNNFLQSVAIEKQPADSSKMIESPIISVL